MTVAATPAHHNGSFWQSDWGEYSPNAALTESIRADVAIVGGGYTGLNTAWLFKTDNPNARVVVVEGAVIGFGASGSNAGFSTKMFGLEPELVLRRWGEQKMLDAFRYVERAVAHTKDLIESNDLQSDYSHPGSVRVSYSEKQLKRLEKDHQVFQRLGIAGDLHMADAGQLRQEFHTDRFVGGYYEANTGLLNPCKHVRELKRLAESAGVDIYEMSRVTHVERSGNALVVNARDGKVTADKVVVAGNAYSHGVHGPRGLANKQFPLWTYAVVTEPLSPQQWESIGWVKRQSFGDNRQLLHYFRPTTDGRILMGGGDVLIYDRNRMDQNESVATWRHCENFLKWIYPQLGDVRIDYRWGGPVSVNMDLVPEISFIEDERIIYSGGCFGHGVALTHLNGRTIADLLNGEKTELTEFWIVNRKSIRMPGNTLSVVGGTAACKLLKAWDWWEERGVR